MPHANIRSRAIFYTDTQSTTHNDTAPLIFVHGLGSTSSFFHPITPLLSAKGHRCITFDNYGAGRSPLQSEKSTTISSIASDVVGLLDHLSIPKAVVIGYSMGGLVPLQVATAYPDRIIASISLGPVNPENRSGVKTLLERIEVVQNHGMEAMAQSIPANAPAKSASHLSRAFIREMILSQEVEGYVANIRAIEAAEIPKYDAIKCPVYIIVGDEDKSCPVDRCKEMFEKMPANKTNDFKVVQDCGHWYGVEKPDEMADLIGSWCAKI